MSFQAASKDLSRDKQFTSMTLIGGYDCDVSNPRKGVDLRVKGGAIIEKSLCVLGNLNVAGMLSSEVSGNVLTDKIQEAELMQGIQVCGNLIMVEESLLIGNVCIPDGGQIQTPKIVEKVVGEGVCFGSDITSDGDLTICNDGDLILKPTGTVIINNTAQSLDLSKQVIGNILRLEAAPGCPLGLRTDSGFKIEVTGGDGIDLMGRDLCNVGNFMGNVSLDGDLDMMCANIGNVETIRCNLWLGKNSPFFVGDLMNIVSGTVGGVGIDMNDRSIDNADTINAVTINTTDVNATDNVQAVRINQAPFATNLTPSSSGDVLTWNGSQFLPLPVSTPTLSLPSAGYALGAQFSDALQANWFVPWDTAIIPDTIGGSVSPTYAGGQWQASRDGQPTTAWNCPTTGTYMITVQVASDSNTSRTAKWYAENISVPNGVFGFCTCSGDQIATQMTNIITLSAGNRIAVYPIVNLEDPCLWGNYSPPLQASNAPHIANPVKIYIVKLA
jgi:hypothetical protein